MAADGSLKFDTKIDTTDFDKSVSTLEKAMDRLTQSVDRLAGKIVNGFNGASDAVENTGTKAEKAAQGVEKIEDAAKKAKEEANDLQKQMDAIQVHRYEPEEPVDTGPEEPRVSHPPGEFEDIGAQAQKFVDDYVVGMENAEQHTNEFKQEISTLEARLKALESQGMYFGDEEYDEAYLKLSRVKQALADYKKEMLSPTPDAVIFPADSLMGKINRMKKELADLNAQGKTFGDATYDSTYQALAQAESQLTAYKRSLMEADQGQKQVNKSAKEMRVSLDKAGKSAKGVKKQMTLLGMLGKSILYSFVFRAISMVTTAVKEGFQNLAQYSGSVNTTLSSLSSSMLYLKNSFAVGFAPILDFVVPAINTMIDAIATALAWIAQLFAALTGKATFVRAKKTQEDYAASLKKTGAAAKGAGKDAKGALAPFDQLTQLQDQASSGDGGGGTSATDPSEMFETVAVSGQLVSVLDTLKEKMAELGEIFKNGFEFGLGDTEARIATIKVGFESIKESLTNIFTDPDVVSAAKTWAEIIIYDLGVITGSIASIGLTIATNLIGGIAMYLQEAQERIKQYLIDMFDITGSIATIAANFSTAFAEVFSVFAGENGQTFTANLIGFFANSFMGATELFAKLGRDLLNALLTPFTNNAEGFKTALDGLLGVAGQVMGDIKDIFTDSFDKINQVYDEHIGPMFDKFTEGFTEIYGTALEAFNTHILPVLQDAADRFTEFKDEHLQPLIDKFLDFGGKVADTVVIIWDNALKPFVEWAINTFAPMIADVIKNISENFNSVMEVISEVASHILDALNGVLEFIQGVFNGDTEQALNGLKEVFRGVFNGIITIVESAVNGIISCLNNISFDIPDWSPIGGGTHFGFDISPIHIPRLATGTVVPPRAGEFAAILGDNNREAEVVSPLSTMKQAFAEVMSEIGGAFGGDINLTVNLDGDTIYKSVVKRNKDQSTITGRNPLLDM